MRLRAAVLMIAGFTGCVHGPGGALVSAQANLEAVKAPVVCGPIGFRRTPLQARWGEYVKVSVVAATPLKGTAIVHAGGVAYEPQAFQANGPGAVVIDARFPNQDPDARFVLERERPIDITLTTLEGTCEGAVFTVEHGALVPDVDERTWIAELERRGGPELAARREAARKEADARREAHYALWASRQVEVSAEVLEQREAIREEHYAAVDARRAICGSSTCSVPETTAVASVEVNATPGLSEPVEDRPTVSVSAAATMNTAPGLSEPVEDRPTVNLTTAATEFALPEFDAASSTTAVASASVATEASGAYDASAWAAPSANATLANPLPDPLPSGGEGGTVAVDASGWAAPTPSVNVGGDASVWATPSVTATIGSAQSGSLQQVPVTTESSVPCPPGTEPMPAPTPVPAQQVEVVVPVGMINLLLDVAAGLTSIPTAPPPHAARPAR
jgi:hypothetical protein